MKDKTQKFVPVPGSREGSNQYARGKIDVEIEETIDFQRLADALLAHERSLGALLASWVSMGYPPLEERSFSDQMADEWSDVTPCSR